MIDSLKPLDFGGKKYLSVEEALAELAKYGPAPDVLPALPQPVSPVVSPHEGFCIEHDENRGLYVLHNVVVEAGKLKGDWVVGWGEELLDGGKPHSQDEFVNMTKNDDLRLCPGPLYHASIDGVLQYATKAIGEQKMLADKLIGLFRRDFDVKNPYMLSGSRVVYMPARQKDKVIHNYGYLDTIEEVLDLVGPDWLEINASSVLETQIEGLLGTINLSRVSEVYKTLTGKVAKLGRFSSKPAQRTERVLLLGCNDYYFVIYASGNISRPARGAVARRAQKK